MCNLGYVWQWNEIWKWNGTVADLIDVRKKSNNVLYKKVKKKKNCFIMIFFI